MSYNPQYGYNVQQTSSPPIVLQSQQQPISYQPAVAVPAYQSGGFVSPPPPRRYGQMICSMLPFFLALIFLAVSSTKAEWLDFQVLFPASAGGGSVDFWSAPFSYEICILSNCQTQSISDDDINTLQNGCGNVIFQTAKYDECQELKDWKASRGSLVAGIIFSGVTMLFLPIHIVLSQKENLSRTLSMILTLTSVLLCIVTAVMCVLPSALWIAIMVFRLQFLSTNNFPSSISVLIGSGMGLAFAGAAMGIIGCISFLSMLCCCLRRPVVVMNVNDGNVYQRM